LNFDLLRFAVPDRPGWAQEIQKQEAIPGFFFFVCMIPMINEYGIPGL
jgi:hypothetical protein